MSFDYRGFFHIHSAFSCDGTTDIKEIIRSAERCGADFIVITDHFNMKAKEEGFEGWHNGLFVICGEEISPSYNHYLAIGIKKAVLAAPDENPQKYIDAVKRDGGIGLIAHPDHTGTKTFGVRSYAWKNWDVNGFDSLSVWDLMTDWQDKLASFFRAALAIVFPAFILSGPRKETLERWDRLNLDKTGNRLISGYGEIDNHDFRKKVFAMTFRIFPFDFAFKTVSTHILLKKELSADAEEAKTQIMESVKNSSVYIAQEKWKSSKGFEFYITDGLKTAYSGETLEKTGPAFVKVKLPQKALIKIIHNGKELCSGFADAFSAEAKEAGIYRVEAYQKKCFVYKPWIFSNHIRVN